MNESVMLYLALNIFPNSPYSLEVCIPGIMRLNIPQCIVSDNTEMAEAWWLGTQRVIS